MNELVDWLRAQLDEDARVARAAAEGHPVGSWRPSEPFETTSGVLANADARDVVIGPVGNWTGQVAGDHEGFGAVHVTDAEHIARHNPARVLREVAAKRAIVDAAGWAREAENNDYTAGWAEGLEHSLYLLAVAYDDRPGYRDEWRPT